MGSNFEVATYFVCHPRVGGDQSKNQALCLKDKWIPACAGTTHTKIICNIDKIYAVKKCDDTSKPDPIVALS